MSKVNVFCVIWLLPVIFTLKLNISLALFGKEQISQVNCITEMCQFTKMVLLNPCDERFFFLLYASNVHYSIWDHVEYFEKRTFLRFFPNITEEFSIVWGVKTLKTTSLPRVVLSLNTSYIDVVSLPGCRSCHKTKKKDKKTDRNKEKSYHCMHPSFC